MLPDATAVSSALAAASVNAEIEQTGPGLVARISAAENLTALEALRDSALDFRMLADMFGTDTGEQIEITYHLRSLTRDEEMYVRLLVPYDGELHSVWNVYPAALLPEREAAELLGFVLAGHPNPHRLFTTEGIAPLLRKSVPVRTAEEVRNR